MTWCEFLLFVHISASVMAIKPTGDDVGALIGMAAIFAIGLAWAISAAQSVTVPESAPA